MQTTNYQITANDVYVPDRKNVGIFGLYADVAAELAGRDEFIINPFTFVVRNDETRITHFLINGPKSNMMVALNHTYANPVYVVTSAANSNPDAYATKRVTTPNEVSQYLADFIVHNSPKP